MYFAIAGVCGADHDGGWKTATPEEVGLDSAPLVELFDFVRKREIPVHSCKSCGMGDWRWMRILPLWIAPREANVLNTIRDISF